MAGDDGSSERPAPSSARSESERPEAPRPDGLRPDSLRPDSLRPDSLRPDSLRPDSLRAPAPGSTEQVSLRPPRTRRRPAPAPERAAESSSSPTPPARRRSSLPPPLEAPPIPRRPPSAPPPPSDPRIDEGHGVLAERVQADLDAVGVDLPGPLPPDRRQRMQALVGELAASAPELDEPLRARVLAMGPEVLPTLAAAFPGATWVNLARPHRPLRSGRHLSAVAAAMIAFGEEAVPHVASLLRSASAPIRHGACLVAADLAHGELVGPLAARLLDETVAVRDAAMLALRASAQLPETRRLRSELCETLVDRDRKIEWRVKAATTLGRLRDAEAGPQLIEQLGAEPPVAQAARDALVLISGHDLGRFRFRWRKWWSKHGDRSRAAWLVEALDDADLSRRLGAFDELVLLTGEGFDQRGELATREGARALADEFRRWLHPGA